MVFRLAFILSLVVCMANAKIGFAQIANNWAFGKHAGIGFSNGSPYTYVTKTSGAGASPTYNWGASSISDCNGNLLFYTNGCKVWDSTHQLMANGKLCTGIVDKSIISPKPGSTSEYLIFKNEQSTSKKFDVTKIDMSLNSGKGKVVYKNQSHSLPNNLVTLGIMTMIDHQNNQDKWLIILTYERNFNGFQDYKFVVYPVTSGGLGSSQVYDISFGGGGSFSGFNLKSTPDGKHLLTNYGFEKYPNTPSLYNPYLATRFDFDQQTGQISNRTGLITRNQVLKNSTYKYKVQGIATAPNNQMIYFSIGQPNPQTQQPQLYQVTNSPNPPATAKKIANIDTPQALQLAPNGKIYHIQSDHYLSVINDPNQKGKACNYQDSIVHFNKGRFGGRFPELYSPNKDIDFKIQSSCTDTTRFTNLTDTTYWDSVRRHGFVWDFGDGTTDTTYQTQHYYDTPGTYVVTLKALNRCKNPMIAKDTVKYYPVHEGFRMDSGTFACREAQFHVKDTSTYAHDYQYAFRDTAWADTVPAQTSTQANPTFTADSTGIFEIKQMASNQYCTDTAYRWDSVYVEQRPKAQFITNDTLGCRPYEVALNNQSTFDSLEPGYVQWQLQKHGDTTTYEAALDSTRDTTFTITDTGFYQARLLAFNNQGCVDTLTKDSLTQVIGRPDPGFTWQTDTQCLKSEVTFNAQYTHAHDYQWDFGNGQTDTLPSTQVTYKKAGQYPIQLTASNEWCVDTMHDTVGILVEPFPKARFSAPDTGNCRPFEVNFNNQSQDAYHYAWFTDGQQFDTANLSHIYTDTGHFDVTLIARNNQGCVDTQVKKDYIYSSPVVNAYFGRDDTVGCEHVTFDFRDSSEHVNQWEWHFGNGDTSNKQHPSYTYINEGQYDITLIASNDYCSDTQTVNDYIDIIRAPKPGFSIQYDQACTPLGVQVNNESTGQIDSFYYTFGNGQTSNQANPSVTYKQEQEYNIKQKLRGVTGCLTQDSLQLTVYEDPEADYTIADTQAFCHEKAFEFKNQSRPEKPPLDSGLLYEWYFGVPEDSVVRDTMKDPVKHYSRSGDYPVNLVATNGLCKDSLEEYLTVNLRQKPELDFKVNDPALCTGQEIQLENHSQNADSFVWRLGDGQIKTGREIDHIYTNPGFYDLRLTAFSEEGCIDSLEKSDYLHVKAHPTADFEFSPKTGCAPLEVDFTNTSQPDSQQQSYTWLTGVGEQFNKENLSYTYENPTSRDYPVTLIADNGNCADSLTQTVKIRGFDGNSESLQLTNVTVQNNQVIELDWEPHPWAENYQIFRKQKGGNMRSTTTTKATTFTDRQANVHENRYFYQVSGIDSCGNVSAPSNTGRNILLEGQNEGNDFGRLWWNPYEQWATGVREYKIEKAESPGQLDPLTVSHDTAHRDKEFFDPKIDSQYYRVHAIQKGNPQIRSTSNILGLPLIPKLHVPNAFSPNGDGHNEVFRAQATGVHNFSLKIYNRWGEEVFSTTNPDEGWDGTYQGQKAPMGTYMYVIYGEGNTSEQFSRQGTVTLMR